MKSSSQGNSFQQRPTSKRKRLKVLLGLVALPFVLWMVAWLAASSLTVSVPLDHADAIVVMSGSAVYKERTQLAAQLYLAGRAPRIILTNDDQQTGWVSDEQRNIPFQEMAARSLMRLGVVESAIEFLPEPVSGTHSEAVRVRQYADDKHLKSILIVTSAYHSRRTLWTIREVFADSGIAIGMEPVPPGFQSPPPGVWWIYRKGWQTVPNEYVKLIYYWLRF